MSEGGAAFAVSQEAQLRALNNSEPADAANAAANFNKYKLMGMSDGEADFAAHLVMPK